jgi:hypothetical protein
MPDDAEEPYPLTRLWKMLRTLDWRDIMERAIWTAAETFGSAWPAGLWLTDLSGLQTAGLAALSAFGGYILAVIKNVAKQTRERRAA